MIRKPGDRQRSYQFGPNSKGASVTILNGIEQTTVGALARHADMCFSAYANLSRCYVCSFDSVSAQIMAGNVFLRHLQALQAKSFFENIK
jgi:hypothetical protein